MRYLTKLQICYAAFFASIGGAFKEHGLLAPAVLLYCFIMLPFNVDKILE